MELMLSKDEAKLWHLVIDAQYKHYYLNDPITTHITMMSMSKHYHYPSLSSSATSSTFDKSNNVVITVSNQSYPIIITLDDDVGAICDTILASNHHIDNNDKRSVIQQQLLQAQVQLGLRIQSSLRDLSSSMMRQHLHLLHIEQRAIVAEAQLMELSTHLQNIELILPVLLQSVDDHDVKTIINHQEITCANDDDDDDGGDKHNTHSDYMIALKRLVNKLEATSYNKDESYPDDNQYYPPPIHDRDDSDDDDSSDETGSFDIRNHNLPPLPTYDDEEEEEANEDDGDDNNRYHDDDEIGNNDDDDDKYQRRDDLTDDLATEVTAMARRNNYQTNNNNNNNYQTNNRNKQHQTNKFQVNKNNNDISEHDDYDDDNIVEAYRQLRFTASSWKSKYQMLRDSSDRTTKRLLAYQRELESSIQSYQEQLEANDIVFNNEVDRLKKVSEEEIDRLKKALQELSDPLLMKGLMSENYALRAQTVR